MIALCRTHADKADAGTFTPEQLREMKATGQARAGAVVGTFDWMRNRLALIAGGAFYYECETPIALGDDRLLWFNRDEGGYFLLNLRMPSTVREDRLVIVDNVWIETGNAQDIESPPNGRLISVKYPNGDRIRVEFFEIPSGNALVRRYRFGEGMREFIENEDQGFPITGVDVRLTVISPQGEAVLDFDAQKFRVGGATFAGAMFVRSGVGLQLG
jgi:hypothetical protein